MQSEVDLPFAMLWLFGVSMEMEIYSKLTTPARRTCVPNVYAQGTTMRLYH